MRNPAACDGTPPQEETWVDPRTELTVLIHDLSDQASQALLDYLREWLKTSTHMLYSLVLFGLNLVV